MGIRKSVLVVVCFLGFQFSHATETPKVDVTQYILEDTPELQTSLAVKKENDRIYLIVEVNHNLLKNSFVLSFHKAGLTPIESIEVNKANKVFGFQNKFQALMPLIEVKTPKGSSLENEIIFVDKDLNRTQQKIDVTRFLNNASKNNGIVGVRGTVYQISDLNELSFVLLKKKDGISIDPSTLKNGEMTQILGEKIIVDVAPQKRKPKRLSSLVVSRYFSDLLVEFKTGDFSIDKKEKIEQILIEMPYDLNADTYAKAVEALLTAKTPQEMVKIGTSLPLKDVGSMAMSCTKLL